MVAKRSTKMGKIKPYIDVRSESDIPSFESMLHVGPVLVLVYADWCGHCQRFKESMWDDVSKSPKKSMNTAAVHYNMVDKTSLKNTSIEGYPSLFEIKPTPTSNVSIPVPTPRTKEELVEIVTTKPNENTLAGERMRRNSARATQASVREPTYSPEELESLPPPLSEDAYGTEPTVQQTPQQQQKGGSLFETLLKVSADAAHAIVLTGSAIEINRRLKKKKQTKRKRSGASKATRKR